MDSINPKDINIKKQNTGETQQYKHLIIRGWKGEKMPDSDKFRKTDSSSGSNDNLIFKVNKIKFYPEDEEKMQSMSFEEKIKYRTHLKTIGKYIVIPDNLENIKNPE